MTILLQRMSEGEEATTSSSGFGAVESAFGNLPLRQLNYHTTMLGLAVRTTILQTYYNPFDEALEATYIFPLEYGHAVIACEMRIGERIVQAELKSEPRRGGIMRKPFAMVIALRCWKRIAPKHSRCASGIFHRAKQFRFAFKLSRSYP